MFRFSGRCSSGDCDAYSAGGGVALQAFEIGADLGGALIADFAIAFECLADDAAEFQREVGIEL